MDSSFKKFPRCWAEININNLKKNLLFLRDYLTHSIDKNNHINAKDIDFKIMAVVKADAYGHGIKMVGKSIDSFVDGFGVANINEAKDLEQSLINKKNIYVLSPCLPDEFYNVVKSDWIPLVSSFTEISILNNIAEKLNKDARICIMLDTGMGRVGFSPRKFLEKLNDLKLYNNIKIDSIASHFPSADDDEKFSKKQIKIFDSIIKDIKNLSLSFKSVHIQNSAGIINFNVWFDNFCNIVRPGLMIYGSSSVEKFRKRLHQVMSWKSRLVLIKKINQGSSISYSRSFIADRDIDIGIVSIGYGDGYPRSLSNSNACVLIKGHRCKILGKITMDMIMVDLSELIKYKSNLIEGEEVVLIGKQGTEVIYAEELAEKANTIPWEIFTGVTKRVPRVYLNADF